MNTESYGFHSDKIVLIKIVNVCDICDLRIIFKLTGLQCNLNPVAENTGEVWIPALWYFLNVCMQA